jgi:hypothetical protein
MTRIPITELEWHDKRVIEMTREELLEFAEMQHNMLAQSIENYETLAIAQHELLLKLAGQPQERRH